MLDSVVPTVEPATDTSPESRRKRRRKSEGETQRSTGQEQTRRGAKRWRTEREQQIYSSKLFEALRRARRRSDEAGKSSGRVREIRDAADRTLAASARGTTRWSRAILASRARARLRKHKKAKTTGNNRSKRFPATVTQRPTRTRSSTVERKLKILGRLVPGCRKVSVPNLLEETSDYIAALEMQIRSMTALAELLATASPPPQATGA
ncbi:PREDICTED: transcription factor bHLH149-like [Tarenaya hassleriana]|uniref:transcription factor bHLH149-like n=1 Tax=Tarenaya hassleriana TaxID=28532 RepID=UPI00053C75FB|nr:PREDICTED: transcription factor bHLH149-like [Tarenaya hassleriana]